MAERVASALPSTADRITVTYNPVTVPDMATTPRRRFGSPHILCPVIITPRKMMTARLRAALAALDLLAASPEQIDVTLLVTARVGTLEDPLLSGHPRLALIGERSAEGITDLMLRCDAIYFPTELESFGYPLAEGRMMGVPVVARRSAHNIEIAGPALVGYDRECPEDIAAALHTALTTKFSPDQTKKFDRNSYFDQLLGVSRN